MTTDQFTKRIRSMNPPRLRKLAHDSKVSYTTLWRINQSLTAQPHIGTVRKVERFL